MTSLAGVPGAVEPGADPDPALGSDTRLVFRPLSVVRQGEDHLVGGPAVGGYIALPAIGVTVLDLLRSGLTVGQAADRAAELAGEDVDVAEFAATLCAQGFAEPLAPGTPPPERGAGMEPVRTRWATALFGRAGWTVFGLVAAGSAGIYLTRPAMFPRPADLMFLSTPVRSVVAAILVSFLLGICHEVCHWQAARAEGVPARITMSRRLYMMVFETDLTALWSIPRRRRYAPILAGMALDVFLLFGAQVALLGRSAGWWSLPGLAAGALAALCYRQVAVLVPQFYVFLRTDIYAVLVTATGCLNLWQVTRLTVRARLRLATAAQREELARAGTRDRAVARWFSWVYAAGMVAAAWFFVFYFLPVTLRLLSSILHTLASADVGHSAFWESLGFGLLLLSSELVTLWVFTRERRQARRARRGRPALNPH